jgi:hypothetical protein
LDATVPRVFRRFSFRGGGRGSPGRGPRRPGRSLAVHRPRPACARREFSLQRQRGRRSGARDALGQCGTTRPGVLRNTDNNGAYDAETDSLLGTARHCQPLKPGQEATVTASIRGIVRFPKNLVWAWIDSPRSLLDPEERTNCAHSGSNCLVEPLVGKFEPVVKWHQHEFSIEPQSNNVMMTPAVIDLDGDGYPDIVFSTFTRSRNGSRGFGNVLRAVRGTDGSELWAVADPEYEVEAFSGLAVGDIDGDRRPEIVATHKSDVLIAFEHDGTFKWKSPPLWGGILWGSSSLADLDHDGVPEIVIGGTVLSNDGTLRWDGGAAGGVGRGAVAPAGPLSAVADSRP